MLYEILISASMIVYSACSYSEMITAILIIMTSLELVKSPIDVFPGSFIVR